MRFFEARKQISMGVMGLALVGGWCANEVSAAVVYRENFSADATQPLSYAGWIANRGSTATSVEVDFDPNHFPQIVANNGDTPEPSVNSNPAIADGVKGYIYSWGRSTDARYSPSLIWTDEYSIDRSSYSDLKFKFNTNVYTTSTTDPAGKDAFRIAVRIGGSWYVSDPSATAPTATSWANAWTSGMVSGDLSGGWKPLSFTPGSAGFSLGSANVSLPASGNIDAFGMFEDQKSNDVRIGAYEIDGTPVPEPASLGIILMGGAALVERRLRT